MVERTVPKTARQNAVLHISLDSQFLKKLNYSYYYIIRLKEVEPL